jgi:hypothetical protein
VSALEMLASLPQTRPRSSRTRLNAAEFTNVCENATLSAFFRTFHLPQIEATRIPVDMEVSEASYPQKRQRPRDASLHADQAFMMATNLRHTKEASESTHPRPNRFGASPNEQYPGRFKTRSTATSD